jgi:UDP:flavonoid glycosyltransferase YjiC (YdhE family)
MRIGLLTVGSRGDVQPFVALARALAGAGHQPVLATHEPFRPMVEGAGLQFAPLPGDPRAVLETDEAHRLLSSGTSMVRFARRFVGVLRPWFDELIAATAPVVDEVDVVVYTPLAFTAWHQAQTQRKPTVLVSLQPLAPTRHFSTVAGGGVDRGPLLNLTSHRLTQQLFWQPLRSPVNRWRAKALGLAPLPFWGPYRLLDSTREAHLLAYSPLLVPRPPDWPRHVQVTGAWFFEPPFELPPGLEAFLGEGEPPIYVGFGSMSDRGAESIARAVVEAARKVGRRLVLGSGWAGLEHEGSDVYVLGDVPHHAVFPRMAAVVHHGGAGTTHSAARAGVPQVVVPFFADQPFWAGRVSALGIGSRPIPRRDLDSGRLATEIGLALRDSTVRQAREVGEELRRERGTDIAVHLIDRIGRHRAFPGCEPFDLP